MNNRVFVLGLLAITSGDAPIPTHESNDRDVEASSARADRISSTSTYYSIKRDLRKCAWPICGGYFVSRVNRSNTGCHDGRYAVACYVANVDIQNGLGLDAKEAAAFGAVIDAGQAVLRGTIKRGTDGLGFFVPTEGYSAATAVAPAGTFYRASESGIRCLWPRCRSVHEAKLNSTVSRNVVLNLSDVGASDDQLTVAYRELDAHDLIIAGSNTSRTVLHARQFYLRARHKMVASIHPRTY
jgi:hypothetical protein